MLAVFLLIGLPLLFMLSIWLWEWFHNRSREREEKKQQQQREQERKQADEGWVNQPERRRLAELYLQRKPLITLQEYNFSENSKESLFKNRAFLLETRTYYEQNKNLLVNNFQEWRNWGSNPRTIENFTSIVTEYQNALACLSQALAEIEIKLEKANNPSPSERRGAPPPTNGKTATPQVTPEPSWSFDANGTTQNEAAIIKEGLEFCGFASGEAQSILINFGLQGGREKLLKALKTLLHKENYLSEAEATKVIQENGIVGTINALKGRTADNPQAALPPESR